MRVFYIVLAAVLYCICALCCSQSSHIATETNKIYFTHTHIDTLITMVRQPDQERSNKLQH